ncbi:A-kinase anchor protein 1, mitochondrial [Sorex araneus]|uniref:A-kinase anchor protein 1, mitochondrial n=1 Tax=Sorex araneus TaxID=42254 RepID=UPI0024338EE6|nr:A-kinase anchor protein 1, mitochondrial [Sorex araneus]XP_054989104.1 A-kinase anchor protein 1, mitochondrial [Sorex araneus]
MAIQLRALFPLAVPGMLALLGWWWFFSRKKEHSSTPAVPEEVGATPAPEEETFPGGDPGPRLASTPLRVSLPPEKELSPAGKPVVEPPALLRAQPVCRRSESSGSLPSTTDPRLRPGIRKDDGAQVGLAPTGDEAKSVPRECHLPASRAVPFPHEAAEMCKRESLLSRTSGQGRQSQAGAQAEKHGAGEKGRERAEGTGDAAAAPGESVLEEGLLSQEFGPELQSSRGPGPAPSGGGGERGPSGRPSGKAGGKACAHPAELGKEEEVARTEPGQAESPEPPGRGGRTRDRDAPAGKPGPEKALDQDEAIEQAAFQLISKVILGATEEVLATTVGKIAGCLGQAPASQCPGQEERGAPGGQQRAPPTPAPAAEDAPLPKTYVSCLTSPLCSPTKDKKPKTSAHHLSLTPACPPPATPPGELLGGAGVPVEDPGCVPCSSDSSQAVPSVASRQSSDSASTLGQEDSGPETSSSPRDKASTPPLPESTVPFSNGVLKGLSDLGAEDGWPPDAEADHSGGSDGNSMDSVDGCCGPRKTDDFQSAQTGSSPQKVDLIIWEIEVPKHLVGRLIGKQGRYVSFLKQTSGAKIYISTLPYTQNVQICHIEGSQHHVDKALNLIGKKFKELNLTNIYAPPLPSLPLPSLPMTSWLMLPDGITVEVIVVSQVNAGHLFVQQHTHPTFHALRSLDQQMFLCYSQPGIPTLPTPVEITVICAAPGVDGAWWRAQVVASYEDTDEVEIRYVDYGGYKRVKVDVLRQIRSDFVTLPFQGAEVLLDSVMPLSDDDHFSPEADAAMSEMTGNTALLAQVTNYSATGLPLIQLWSVVGDEVVLINRLLVERGLAQWVDSYYASL